MKRLRQHQRTIRIIAVYFSLNILLSTFLPTLSYGLTGGPSSPEFASFEPVATTDMVNTFTGDFTYNLPILHVPVPGGGYPLSLSYHSGNNSEQEASWVGFGWTLNPGAVNRNVRGVPDEYNGEVIDYYNKAVPNITTTSGKYASFEKMSDSKNSNSNKDKGSLKNHSPHGLNIGDNIRFNNYQGFSRSFTIGATLKGYGSIGLHSSPSGVTFSGNLDIRSLLSKGVKSSQKKNESNQSTQDANQQETRKKAPSELSRSVNKSLSQLQKFRKKNSISFGISSISAGSDYGILSYGTMAPSFPVSPTRGFGFNFNISDLTSLSPNTGLEVGGKGSFMMHYNKKHIARPSYGFMHNQGNPDKEAMSDYYVDGGSSWDKQDLYLGVPFSTPDHFNLNGEGLGGSFRLHNTQPGHFFPPRSSSKKVLFNLGLEVQVGTSIGLGLSVGAGFQETKIKKWGQYDGGSPVSYLSNGGTVMRFSGDKAGSVVYGNDNLMTAKVYKPTWEPGAAAGKLSFNQMDISPPTIKTSSKITYDDKLTHFNIVNKEGTVYSYGRKTNAAGITGATAYNRNEASLGVEAPEEIEDRYLCYGRLGLVSEGETHKVEECSHKVINGSIKTTPFASTYMLGEIHSPYYVDVDNNGPTDNDFGGWTKFEYFKKYGTNNDEGNSRWYRWRIPYNGFNYVENSLSDKKDNIGAVSTGEKEVYYLKKIETKTHVAYFVTNKTTVDRFDAPVASEKYLSGSTKYRSDGLGAAQLAGNEDPAGYKGIKGTDYLEQLEKIVLFSKKRPDKPLQTTHFSYSHRLVQGLPNGGGKLTLEKVWTDYEGENGNNPRAKISPYVFSYQYKSKGSYPEELTSRYTAELGEFFNLSNGTLGKYTSSSENPSYSPHLLGPWGFTQPRGKSQHEQQRPWLYQGKLTRFDDYDPAAWQLKGVKLPSGGEILVEYEGKDYSYVQNRRPMAMARVKAFEDKNPIELLSYKKDPYYVVNLEDIGLMPGDEDYASKAFSLASYMHDYYVNQHNRIYFKFLYALEGNTASFNNCRSEYITGYVKVSSVDYDEGLGGIKITLDGTGSAHDKKKAGYSMIPRQGCFDFYSTQRVGLLEGGCDSEEGPVNDEEAEGYLKAHEGCDGDGRIFRWPGFVGVFGDVANDINNFFKNKNNLPKQKVELSRVCLSFNKDLSYIKIPMLHAKRGGGMRVKRLLMYDPGLESGDAMIYGKAYHYVNEAGESSGVATNEPEGMREENALVGFLPKRKQSWFRRLTIGRDKEQSEGPLGASMLPGASVGHNRVIEENIHTGKSSSGFTVHTFHTVYDYPFDHTYSSQGKEGRYDYSFKNGKRGIVNTDLKSNTKKDLMNLSLCRGGIVFGYKSKKIWSAQGFRFIHNDMHGKPQTVKTYGGTLPTDYKIDEGNAFIASGQQYEYYEPGELVPMLNADGTVEWDTPGKEVDIAMDMRSVKERGLDISIAIDFSITLPLPPPILTPSFAGANIGYSEKILSTHSTSKVIKYPSMVKSVVTYRDGMSNIVENLGFDRETGETLLTSSRDVFDGIHNEDFAEHEQLNAKTYQFQLPGHWYYDGLKTANRLSESVGSILSMGRRGEIREENTWHYPTDIISANVRTYGTSGSNEGNYNWFPPSVMNDYESPIGDAETMVRPSAEYTYDADPVNQLREGEENKKLYEEGVIQNFVPFNYLAANSNPNWLKLGQVTKYSPHGEALEDVDIEGIYSAGKYAYDGTRMVMNVSNAQYEEIYFNGYEDRESKHHHSGIGSLSLFGGGSQPLLENIFITPHLLEKGAIFKCWFHDPNDELNLRLNVLANYQSGNSSSNWKTPKDVAKVGEWILKELHLSPAELRGFKYPTFNRQVNFEDIEEEVFEDITIIAEVSGTRSKVYLDDVRFQPGDATGSCYVYDQRSLRLITQFDDAHFGMYYQYNHEGQLVRKLIETERGMKTVEETQYNLPLVRR